MSVNADGHVFTAELAVTNCKSAEGHVSSAELAINVCEC